MLTPNQITHVWEGLLAAETRALYFSDLATRYARQKQWITGLSFFLSSGAAATIVGKAPALVPIILSLVTASLTAYSIATALDRKTSTMAKLTSSWREIAAAYDRLWNHAYEPDAGKQLDEIIQLEKGPSDIATTEAPPTDEKRLERWQERVFQLHRLTSRDAA